MNPVDTFLQNGDLGKDDPSSLATSCDMQIRQVAASSLKDAVSLSKRFVEVSRKHGGVLLTMANRTLARNLHMSGNYREAEKAYLEAYMLSKGDTRVLALLDRAMVDLYMYLGNLPEANKRVKLALKGFEKLNAEDDIAKTKVNYGNLLHRQDRHKEAEEIYRQAALYFEKTGEMAAVARCYYNRANPLVQLFEFSKAEKLYKKAKEIYSGMGQVLDACDCDYSLAWLKMLQGDYHPALLELEECEQIYTTAGQAKGAALCQLDRAELLLSLQLFEDAFETSENAANQFKKLGISYELGKAFYFKAMAALSMDNMRVARNLLPKIIEIFKNEKNHGFLGAAYLLQARTQKDEKEKQKQLKLAYKQFEKSQLPLWEAVTKLELAESSRRSFDLLNELVKNKVIRTVPFLFANWQTLLGEEYLEQGKSAKAISAWQKAADRIDMIRNQLPPVEFRTGYNQRTRSPHLKLIQYELPTNPQMASVWAERYQTAGTWAPVENSDEMHNRIEDSLSKLGQQFIALYKQKMADSSERSLRTDQYTKNMNKLQNQIKNQLTHIEDIKIGKVSPLSQLADDFQKVSNRIPIIQLMIIEEDILAFVYEKKQIRYHKFSKGAARLSNFLLQFRFVLEKIQLTSMDKLDAELNLERKLLESISEWFWKPLEVHKRYTDILILASGELANIPWQGLIQNGEYISDETNFLVCPSLRHYIKAKKMKIKSKKQMLFSGHTEQIPKVDDEISSVKELSELPVSVFAPSCRHDWPKSGEYALWHYAGHSYLRSDNPFYSYLDLEDGPLFAADFRLRDVRVNLVVLAACRTAEQTTVSGEEPTGIVRSLLEMGAKNILAGQWQVSDKITSEWMKIFYSEYFKTKNLNESLVKTKKVIREKYRSIYYWGPFILYGAAV